MDRRKFIAASAMLAVSTAGALALGSLSQKTKGVISHGRGVDPDMGPGIIGVRLYGTHSHHEVLQIAFNEAAKSGATVVIDGQQIYLDQDVIIPKGVKVKITNNHFHGKNLACV